MNSKLLLIEQQWREQIMEPYIIANPDMNLSNLYFMGVTKEYETASKKIMIVGQEPYDFDLYNKHLKTKDKQLWAVEYVNRQVHGFGSSEYNNSPFWNAFRSMQKKCIEPCWNNIDNLHRLVGEKTFALTSKIESDIHVCVKNKKTLLQLQIEITNPDAIWFVTGPYYSKPMGLELRIDEKSIKEYVPNNSCFCQDISHLISDGRFYFWSYHPRYLQMNGQLEKVVDSISDYIIFGH